MDDELRDVLEGGLEGFAGDLGETIDRLVESVHAEAVADEENSKEAVTVEEGSLPRAKTKAMSEEARHQLEAAKTTFDERLRASDVEVWRIEDLVSVARRERVRGASATKSFFPRRVVPGRQLRAPREAPPHARRLPALPRARRALAGMPRP